MARRRRRARRLQGVLRARRPVQGRRHLDLRARRRQPRRQLGRQSAIRPASCRCSTTSKARARTPPRRRGAARSALDAVELMDIGWNFRREHLRLQQRSHYVITNGGDQPNVVPPNASVWYYFREVSYPAIKQMWEIGDKMAEARGDDDRHHGHQHRARLGVARSLQQDDRRSDVRQHREGRPAAVVRGRSGAGPRAAARAESAGGWAGDEAPAASWPRGDPGRRETRRRLRRHRRHLVERADGDAAVSVEHGGRSRPQLGERHLDGDADRAQGHPGRRQGGGADGASTS